MPISGSRFGPNTSRATIRMTTSPVIPISGMTSSLAGFGHRNGRPSEAAWARLRCDGIARDQEPARLPRGDRQGDRQGRRPRGRPRPGARGHGPERLGQVDARLRADGPSGVRDHRGRDPLRRREPRRAGGGRARAARPLPRVPVPARRPRRDRDELPALGDQRDPQGARGQGRPDPDPRVPQGAAREDGGAEGHPRARAALHQRRLLGRRAQEDGDAAARDAEAAHGRARRDRHRARHRRAQGRRQRGQHARRPRHGRARDHPLPARAQLHQAELRARLLRRQDRRRGRAGAGPDTLEAEGYKAFIPELEGAAAA